ncbi:MAG: chromate efflux transporter [Filomicrobium sp.]
MIGSAAEIDTKREEVSASVTFTEALGVWLKIGLLSFGGPAAQIALMHRVLVDERRWFAERQFLSALNFCMLLPGPEAMQLATYAGWRMHGVRGGLAAGLLFVMPGAILMLALSVIYALYGQLPAMEVLFLGVKAAVLAIVLEALIRVARRALQTKEHWLLAGLSFAALFFFNVPFPVVVLAAAMIGVVSSWRSGEGVAALAPEGAMSVPAAAPPRTLVTVATWLAIWLGPLAVLWIVLGDDHILVKLGLFFSKLAVVTFGGAYAVLAYMAQEVVQGYGWLNAGEMLDGLGLAETTLGPLILVTEFVGFLAAYREAGGASLLMGIAGAAVTLWATFTPCFLWIFAGAPYVEQLQHAVRLRAALAAVTAAVVGVILNLSLWFGLRVLFGQFGRIEIGPVTLDVPILQSIDWRAAVLSIVAGVALFRFKAGVIVTLMICAAASFALSN